VVGDTDVAAHPCDGEPAERVGGIR
jgi:hypothetical protein